MALITEDPVPGPEEEQPNDDGLLVSDDIPGDAPPGDPAADEPAAPGASGLPSPPGSIDVTITEVAVAVLGQDGSLLYLPHAGLTVEENTGEWSVKVSMQVPDCETDHGAMIGLVSMGTPLFLYTNEGGTAPMAECWRGKILEVTRDTDSGHIGLTAYEIHKPMLETTIDVNFPDGLTGAEMLRKLATQKAFTLGDVQGPNEKLPGLTDRGKTLAQIIQWIFDQTQTAGGGLWAIRSHTGVIDVVAYGDNATVYHFIRGQSSIKSNLAGSISKLVTQSVVIGQAADSDRGTEVARQDGLTEFGQGITKYIYIDTTQPDEQTRLAAQMVLAAQGRAEWKRQAVAPLVMAVHKGHRVRWLDAVNDGFFYVMGASKQVSNYTMTLDLMTQEDVDMATAQLKLQAQQQAIAPSAQTLGKNADTTGKSGHAVIRHAWTTARDGTPSGWTSAGTHGGHPAADIFCASGTPITAPEDGTMEPLEAPSGGHAGILTGASGRAYYFAHCLQPMTGGQVTRGQTIGKADNSGNAANTETHLHFAVATSASVFGQLNGSGDIEGDPSYWIADDAGKDQP